MPPRSRLLPDPQLCRGQEPSRGRSHRPIKPLQAPPGTPRHSCGIGIGRLPPFEQDAANRFFQLVSSRYEHASLILTSNLPFARCGDVLGDQVVAAAMIDRIVHHAEVVTLKGSSHRLRNTGFDTLPSARAENTAH